MVHIDDRTMTELRLQLQRRRTELVRELAGAEAAAHTDLSEGREPEDEVDLASREVLGGPDPAIRENHRRELALIDAALRRMANGTYGTDAQGREISVDRLRAIPWATS